MMFGVRTRTWNNFIFQRMSKALLGRTVTEVKERGDDPLTFWINNKCERVGR